jgi:hypothetical protein
MSEDDLQDHGVNEQSGAEFVPGHLHLEWLSNTARDMAEDYAKIHARVSKSKSRTQESGHEIEAAWISFLSNWLPPSYEVVGRRYIIGEVETDAVPFETDIVVFRPSYPKILRSRHEVLASGVAAAFSVKSTLRPASIQEAVEACAKIQRSLAPRSGSTRKDLVRPFPFGILAHSHMWKQPASKPSDNVSNELYRRDIEHARHPRESIDLICVPDLGVWSKSSIYIHGKAYPGIQDSLQTFHTFTGTEGGGHAVAVFLTALYSRLALQDVTLRELALSFTHMGSASRGSGLSREWAVPSVLSEEARSKVSNGNWGEPNSENGVFFGGVTKWG